LKSARCTHMITFEDAMFRNNSIIWYAMTIRPKSMVIFSNCECNCHRRGGERAVALCHLAQLMSPAGKITSSGISSETTRQRGVEWRIQEIWRYTREDRVIWTKCSWKKCMLNCFFSISVWTPNNSASLPYWCDATRLRGFYRGPIILLLQGVHQLNFWVCKGAPKTPKSISRGLGLWVYQHWGW